MACALGMWPREEAFEAICLMTSRLEGSISPGTQQREGKIVPLLLPLVGHGEYLSQPRRPAAPA